MNRKTKLFIVLATTALILFMIPYSRDVDGFKSDDVQWEILHTAKRLRVFDNNQRRFVLKTELSEEVQALDNTQLSISGYFYSEKIGNDTLYLLSENRQDVCAFCNHDEHGYNILLFFDTDRAIPDYPTDDDNVRVSGRFMISDSIKSFSPFVITDIQSIEKINKNVE